MKQIFFSLISFLFLCGFSPIVLTVPFGVGGPTDVIARNIEFSIEKNSKIKIAVINQSGASGNIGMRSFHQKDRGLLLMTEGIFINKKYMPDSYPDKIIETITPIYFFGNSPYIIYAHNRFTSLQNLIEISKSREILIGSAGRGSGSYESMNLMCNVKKILENCRIIIYASASSAIMDIISGRIDVFNSLYAGYNTFTSSQTVNALAVMSKKRFESLNHIPSTYELNIELENDNWYGLFAKGLSKEEITIITESMNSFFDKTKLNSLGYEPINKSYEEYWLELIKKYK